MAGKTARLGYNDGPPTVQIQYEGEPIPLTRGKKTEPLPIEAVACVMAFPPKSFVPLAFDIEEKDLRAAIEAARKARHQLTAGKKSGIDPVKFKEVYDTCKVPSGIARALDVPVNKVKAYADKAGLALEAEKRLEGGIGPVQVDLTLEVNPDAVIDIVDARIEEKKARPKPEKKGGNQ